MKKDDRIYLDHILESFAKVNQYLEGVSYAAYLTDAEKQDAIIRKIEVAGEAAKRLSPELREKYPSVPSVACHCRDARQTDPRLFCSRFRYRLGNCHQRYPRVGF